MTTHSGFPAVRGAETIQFINYINRVGEQGGMFKREGMHVYI